MKTRYAPLLVAALLVGCGGDTSGDNAGGEAPPVDDEAAVTQVVEDYFNALGSGSYEEACGYLSETALEQVSEYPGAPAGDCEQSIAAAFSTLPPTELERLRNTEVGAVEVSGDTATVQTPAQPVPLVRTDEGWKIASLGQPTA